MTSKEISEKLAALCQQLGDFVVQLDDANAKQAQLEANIRAVKDEIARGRVALQRALDAEAPKPAEAPK
jgi:peptidoglycan hydrolase CwlO-like protein